MHFIAKQQLSFRIFRNVVYTFTNAKISLHKLNDKEIQDGNRIATYSLLSNIPIIKYVDGKMILNSIENLKQICKEFI